MSRPHHCHDPRRGRAPEHGTALAALVVLATALANAAARAQQTDAGETDVADAAEQAGSRVPRLTLQPEAVPFSAGPLSLGVQSAELLRARRQSGGVAPSDTSAALGLGAPGALRLELRSMPTLVLLNGRRLIAAPMAGGELGAEFVDTSQLPLALIDHLEIAKGTQSALYGSDAIAGVVNAVTRRDYDGLELEAELGAQTTDGFEQDEEDVTLALGYGTPRGGVSAMLGYSRRRPLAASDRSFVAERAVHIDSLISNPASFVRLLGRANTLADPNCDAALARSLGASKELRLPHYGPIAADRPAAEQPTYANVVSAEDEELFEGAFDTNHDGMFSESELFAFCTGDFSRNLDLVLDEQRIQGYATSWLELGADSELFAEAGYYRNDNQNRTAPSFPILNRLSPTLIDPGRDPSDPAYDPYAHRVLLVPLDLPGTAGVDEEHQDLPTYPPFTGQGMSRVAQQLIGRTEGNFAPPRSNAREVEALRGVIGVRQELQPGWDWELAGSYDVSRQEARVADAIVDSLITALESCGAPSAAERQLDGCYNPFFSSVLNSAVLNPAFRDESVPHRRGYPVTDTDGDGQADRAAGLVVEEPCRDPDDDTSDPEIAARPECPAGFDSSWYGTVNSAEVIDRITGESTSDTRRSLLAVDGSVRGELAQLTGGALAFALGGQFRRETLSIDYDRVYNDGGYVFLYGGPDLSAQARHVIAGMAELRLPLATGLELQTAGRFDYYDDVGGAPSALGGVGWRPFAAFSSAALEWLVLRGSVGYGQQPPSLLQLYGTQVRLEEVDYDEGTHFVAYRMRGNRELEPEKVLDTSLGLEWDFLGLHVVADYYRAFISDVVAAPNPRALSALCDEYFEVVGEPCDDIVLEETGGSLEGFSSPFANMAEVETDGIDGAVGYTLDSKRRNLGEFGSLSLTVQGSYLRSYFITDTNATTVSRIRTFERMDPEAVPVAAPNPRRVLREYYGSGFEAAGERNYDNFAPPLPRLRANIPLRWSFSGHTLSFVSRYVGGYHDASENSFEELGYEPDVPAQLTFDSSYSYEFSLGSVAPRVELRIELGVINLGDQDPPIVEGSGLGYEVGVHDPRGRVVYARIRGRL